MYLSLYIHIYIYIYIIYIYKYINTYRMLHERSNIAASVAQHLLFNFQGEMSRTHSLWVKKGKAK